MTLNGAIRLEACAARQTGFMMRLGMLQSSHAAHGTSIPRTSLQDKSFAMYGKDTRSALSTLWLDLQRFARGTTRVPTPSPALCVRATVLALSAVRVCRWLYVVDVSPAPRPGCETT